MPDSPLDIDEDLPSVCLVPAPIKILSHRPELHHQSFMQLAVEKPKAFCRLTDERCESSAQGHVIRP
jgi:hypothetical protein